MGERQVHRQQDDQRQIRDGVGEASVQTGDPVSAMLGSGISFLRVEARREGEAAVAHPAQG
jgi:hypothetical protein